MKETKVTPSALSQVKLEYEHHENFDWLKAIGSYKTKRRERQARKPKEPVRSAMLLSSRSR